MSYAISPAGLCEAALLSLSGLSGQNTPAAKLTPVGLTRALASSYNRAGFASSPLDAGDGHRRRARIKYLQRGSKSKVRRQQSCEHTNYKTYLEEELELTKYAELPISITDEYLAQLCADASQIGEFMRLNPGEPQPENTVLMNVFAELILSELNGLWQDINEQNVQHIQTQMGFNLGNSPASAAAINIPVVDSVTGASILKGYQMMQHNYLKNEMNGTPLVVGFGNFDLFVHNQQHACCSDAGFDFGSLASSAPFVYFPDLQVDSILGANHLVQMAPGSAQLVTYNRNRGSFAGARGSAFYTTIVDPRLPDVPLDFYAEYVSCGNQTREMRMLVSLDWDLFVLPADAYALDDRLAQVNGLFHYVATDI
jgi:hypothetical protein